MDSTSPASLIHEVMDIARNAGKEILTHYKKSGLKVEIKADQTPVTEADRNANTLICQELSRISRIPVVSEEGGEDELASLGGCEEFWLVDPLDGTKEFIAGTGEFSVNIALIKKRAPVLGVIYSPVQRVLCHAIKNRGAFREEAGMPTRKLKSKPFDFENFTVVMSRRHDPFLPGKLKEHWPGCHVLKQGSSLKFCSIAGGEAHLYIRTGATSLWDTAAGQIILEEAGGILLAEGGVRLTYAPEKIINPHFWAVSDRTEKTNFLSLIPD